MTGGDWRGLERIVSRLISHCGWIDVGLVGRTGDKGADIVGIRQDTDGTLKKWVVQVKAIRGNNYVGPSALTEATSSMTFYGAQRAAVATNGTFTESANRHQRRLTRAGFQVKLWNGSFLNELLSKSSDDHFAKQQLRPYQVDILLKILFAYNHGSTRAQFVLATGLGKTSIASAVTRDLMDKGFKKVLVLCHATDLASQLEQSFWRQLPKSIPTSLFMGGGPPSVRDGVSFGTYQTLIGYLGGLSPDAFDLIIVDEAHHAVAAQFQQCIDHFNPRLLLGMTATPWRGDGAEIDHVFGPPLSTISLTDGMKMGVLAEVDYRVMCDNVDWNEVPKLAGSTRSIKSLNKSLFLPQRDEAVVQAIKSASKEFTSPRIAIFSPSKKHSDRFAHLLCSGGIPTASLSSCDSIERRKRLLDFSAGGLQAVTAVNVLNEGIDIPDVNIIVFMRATHSRRIFVQQLGRGLRLTPTKKKVLVLDFVTDLRRAAEIIAMERDESSEKESENPSDVFLPGRHITFSDSRVGRFIDMWIDDVEAVAGSEASQTLLFPASYE